MPTTNDVRWTTLKEATSQHYKKHWHLALAHFTKKKEKKKKRQSQQALREKKRNLHYKLKAALNGWVLINASIEFRSEQPQMWGAAVEKVLSPRFSAWSWVWWREEVFTGGPQAVGGGAAEEQVSEVGWSLVMKGFAGEERDFELDASGAEPAGVMWSQEWAEIWISRSGRTWDGYNCFSFMWIFFGCSLCWASADR